MEPSVPGGTSAVSDRCEAVADNPGRPDWALEMGEQRQPGSAACHFRHLCIVEVGECDDGNGQGPRGAS
eukprot:4559204-Pyramimonas_sp.AAC.1